MGNLMDGLNSMPWARFEGLPDGWKIEVADIPQRDKFKYTYDLWSAGAAFEAFEIGRTYKVTLRKAGTGDGLWLLNFDTQGRIVNSSYTGKRWKNFEISAPDLTDQSRIFHYPRYRSEMHRLVGGTWIRAKWVDGRAHSNLTYNGEIVSPKDSFYCATMDVLDELVELCKNDSPHSNKCPGVLKNLRIKNSSEMIEDASNFHKILGLINQIPVEPPELAFDHYHAIPVKVQNGCGGPCTFCSLYERKISVLNEETVFRQIDRIAEYLGEELDHFRKVVILEGDGFTMPTEMMIKALNYSRERFEFDEKEPFAHVFCKASTVVAKPIGDLDRLREAGVRSVNMGLESGCQELLDHVKKGQSLDEFREAVCRLRNAKIDVSLNVIAGLGGNKFKEKHVNETIEFVSSLPPGVTVFYSQLEPISNSHYARFQEGKFDGPATSFEIECQQEVFRKKLRAYEYLFVPI